MRTLAASAILALLTSSAHAQEWPSRPVTMVVPFAAGGPMDALARILQPSLAEALGQTIVIENQPGDGGMTGSLRVSQAAPDSHLFVLASTPAQVAKLNAALIKALDDPKLRQRLDATGLIAATPARRSPDYLREFINAETKKWAAPVKASGVNIE